MNRIAVFAATLTLAAGLSAPVMAATSITIGISGWTGFAPLTLAKQAGLFEKHGLDVTLKKVPQASRPLAIASGDLQCAATTVETWLVWNASGVTTKQIFQLDKSYGADGIVVRNDIKTVADLKGKNVASSAPGTSPYFLLAWVLNKNGMSTKDVTVVNLEPDAAAQGLADGEGDLVAGVGLRPGHHHRPRRTPRQRPHQPPRTLRDDHHRPVIPHQPLRKARPIGVLTPHVQHHDVATGRRLPIRARLRRHHHIPQTRERLLKRGPPEPLGPQHQDLHRLNHCRPLHERG